mmetsp:Transcript_33811/g.74429  ORF Transcript_33811/g.74429 Transcript_33811/m.74429 type:complete len:574 (-) Transcript_33811:83-1804(-)
MTMASADGDEGERSRPSSRPRKRHLTPSEAAALTAERRSSLLSDAKSHGPYLWTNSDVRNALRWFRTSTSTPASIPGGAANAAAAATSHEPAINGESSPNVAVSAPCPFSLLRSLLQNPGITEARPMKARKRKRPTEDEESKEAGVERIRRERERQNMRAEDPPLREVLLGYAAASAGRNGGASLVGDADCNDEQSSSSLRAAADRPLDEVRADLSDVACARAETYQLRSLFEVASRSVGSNGAVRADADSPLTGKSITLGGLSRTNLCLAVIDRSEQYFHSASTSIATAYASELYDRLVVLNTCNAVDERKDDIADTECICNDGVLNIAAASQQLLQQLGALASNDRRIMEVSALMLLEPVRRCHPRSASAASFSSIVGRAMAADDAETACSSSLCHDICQMVLGLYGGVSGSSNENAQVEDTSAVLLWSLPSPLLCAISQAYFPFALAYTEYLIQTAVNTHLDVPRQTANRVIHSIDQSYEKESRTTIANGGGDVCASTTRAGVDCHIQRLLELWGSSDRLSSLVEDELDACLKGEHVNADVDIHGEIDGQEKKIAALEFICEAMCMGSRT